MLGVAALDPAYDIYDVRVSLRSTQPTNWLIPAFAVNSILSGIGAVRPATTVFTLAVGRPELVISGVGAALLMMRLFTEPLVLLSQPTKGRFEIVERRDSAYTSIFAPATMVEIKNSCPRFQLLHGTTSMVFFLEWRGI